MRSVSETAKQLQSKSRPVNGANPFLEMERLWAASAIQGFDCLRDVRDTVYEMTFLSIYGSPFMRWIGASYKRTRKSYASCRKFRPSSSA